MRKLLTLIILLIIILSAINGRGLSNIVVIIDPGHGGSDPGAMVRDSSNNIVFNESGYNYDLALRLEKILKDSGVIVFKTTKSKGRVINNTIIPILPVKNAMFSLDNTRVHNGRGLYKRTSYCNLKSKKYSRSKVIFISIHFDVIDPIWGGVRIIRGLNKESDSLSICLQKEFTNHELISNYKWIVIKNNDPIKYKRNLVVLDNANYIKQIPKVLVELGNIKNPVDLSRIKSFETRDLYALILFNSIKKYIEKTDYE